MAQQNNKEKHLKGQTSKESHRLLLGKQRKYEDWIYKNPDRIASIKRGIAQAQAGQLSNIDLELIEDEA